MKYVLYARYEIFLKKQEEFYVMKSCEILEITRQWFLQKNKLREKYESQRYIKEFQSSMWKNFPFVFFTVWSFWENVDFLLCSWRFQRNNIFILFIKQSFFSKTFTFIYLLYMVHHHKKFTLLLNLSCQNTFFQVIKEGINIYVLYNLREKAFL